ncbi:Origin recognition complex, subunit 1 [Balamuthia mandrillaris]
MWRRRRRRKTYFIFRRLQNHRSGQMQKRSPLPIHTLKQGSSCSSPCCPTGCPVATMSATAFLFSCVSPSPAETLALEQMTSFTFVEINGMKLPTPAHAYSQLWHVLSKQHCSPPVACRHLTKHFARGQCFPCVVLLDELDMMMTRSQELVYNLLTWCLSRRAKLVLIGIANTIDLPERILPKVNSRQGTKHILFPAYRKEQLQEIVQSRLECIDTFDSEVVSVIARYVAGVSGDARKALQICRRAVDFAELQTEEEKSKIRIETGTPEMSLNYKVGVEHVTMAINEMKSSLLTRGVQRACLHEKLFLCALMFEARITGVEEPTVEKVSGRHADLCHRLGINCPHPSALMSLCGRLCSSRILCLRERRGPADTTTSSCFSVVGTQDMFLPVALNMDRSTALFALQGDTRLSSILSLLA